MFGSEKIINAALRFLEKRIALAALQVSKSIDKFGGFMEASANSQARTLAKLGAQFEAATQRMEKPTFDVAVDLDPLRAELQVIASKVEMLAKKNGPDLRSTEVLLKLILDSIKENSPKEFPIDALDVVFKGLKPKDSVKFDDKQMASLMAAMTNRGFATDGGTKSATEWQVNTVTLTSANTEYEYTFPANAISWSLKLRGTTGILYYASATGKMPTSGDGTAYITVPAGAARSQDNVEYGGKKMYFQSDTASQVVEIDVFTL